MITLVVIVKMRHAAERRGAALRRGELGTATSSVNCSIHLNWPLAKLGKLGKLGKLATLKLHYKKGSLW